MANTNQLNPAVKTPRTSSEPNTPTPKSGVTWVRLAHDASDIEAMITLGRRLLAESRFRDLPYDEARLRQVGQYGLTHGNPGLLIAERDGHMQGMAVVVIGEHFFSSAKTATIQLLYVTPEARGGSAAVKLLKAIRRVAANVQVHDLHLNVTTGIEPAKTDRFLRRLGFRQTGGNYVLEGIEDGVGANAASTNI